MVPRRRHPRRGRSAHGRLQEHQSRRRRQGFRYNPFGGTERTSDESTAVEWPTPEQITGRMSEVYAIRLLDALDEAGPHVRGHDGKHLIPAR